MKKILFITMALLFGGTGILTAYEQQGFNQYVENADGTIDFWCQQSCAILLGEKTGNDLVKVSSGSYQGAEGMRGYGYIVGSNIYAATVVPVNNYEWSFVDDPIYKQLPAGKKQVAFLVTGPLKAEGVRIEMRSRSLSETLKGTWKRFFKVEQVLPYSINLHYGPKVGGRSWPLFAFVISLLVVVIIALKTKKFSRKHIGETLIITLTVVAVLGGMRLTYDHIVNTYTEMQKFSSIHGEQKTVFELGDYITVTEKVREYLDLDNTNREDDNCAIYAKAHSERPFVAHWASVYLRPCTVVKTGSLAPYHLYYNVRPEAYSGAMAVSGNSFIFFDQTQ